MKIGLSIIVKDEAAVIVRCLQSVRPLCDFFLIADTGSTDGTQDIVRSYLHDHDLAGLVVEQPWLDFATNRTMALAELRRHTDIDYCLMIDADETLQFDQDFDPAAFKASLSADGYNIKTAYGGVAYLRPQLFSNRLDFRFRGVLHEYLESPPGELRLAVAQGITNHPSSEGARSRNPRKYHDDANLLMRVLETEEDPALRTRYQFYLAQSLRDAGEREAAAQAYMQRTTMNGWPEEIFISHYEIGKLYEQLGRPAADVQAAYLSAYQSRPSRAESLVSLARFHRLKDQFALAHLFAQRAVSIAQPGDGLFVDVETYAYRAQDELAVAAYWIGEYRQCFDICTALLEGADLPQAERARIAANRDFAREKLS